MTTPEPLCASNLRQNLLAINDIVGDRLSRAILPSSQDKNGVLWVKSRPRDHTKIPFPRAGSVASSKGESRDKVKPTPIRTPFQASTITVPAAGFLHEK